MLIHPVKHDVGHLRITDQMVAVVAILIELMKVNIIQTRATIKHAVIALSVAVLALLLQIQTQTGIAARRRKILALMSLFTGCR